MTSAEQRLRQQWQGSQRRKANTFLLPNPLGVTLLGRWLDQIEQGKLYELTAQLTDHTGQSVVERLFGDELDSVEWTGCYTGLQLLVLFKLADTEPKQGDGYRLDVIRIIEMDGNKK